MIKLENFTAKTNIFILVLYGLKMNPRVDKIYLQKKLNGEIN